MSNTLLYRIEVRYKKKECCYRLKASAALQRSQQSVLAISCVYDANGTFICWEYCVYSLYVHARRREDTAVAPPAAVDYYCCGLLDCERDFEPSPSGRANIPVRVS